MHYWNVIHLVSISSNTYVSPRPQHRAKKYIRIRIPTHIHTHTHAQNAQVTQRLKIFSKTTECSHISLSLIIYFNKYDLQKNSQHIGNPLNYLFARLLICIWCLQKENSAVNAVTGIKSVLTQANKTI